LSRRYCVHRIDLPGHGRSTGAATINSLEHLKDAVLPHIPAQAVVCGWSLGGLLALKLAQYQALRALVLMSATPRFVGAADWSHGMAPPVFTQFFTRLHDNLNTTVEDFLRLQVRGDSQAAETFAALKHSLMQHPANPVALEHALAILRDADERAALRQIHTPTLVLAGEYDRIAHPNASKYLAEQLPNARFTMIQRAGHAPFISHREQVMTEVHEFLGAVPSTDITHG
jgi:pimeloyl-[acyl-carrier protein] methyl ester esterase